MKILLVTLIALLLVGCDSPFDDDKEARQAVLAMDSASILLISMSDDREDVQLTRLMSELQNKAFLQFENPRYQREFDAVIAYIKKNRPDLVEECKRNQTLARLFP